MSDKKGSTSIFDRLADPSSFHGTHKHRFDKDGHGRGLDGRESVAKGPGYSAGGRSTNGVSDLSQITRSNLNKTGGRMENLKTPQMLDAQETNGGRSKSPSPREREASPRKTAATGGSIFDRLADPSSFHGTHKHRFDKEGNGVGKVGRTQETGTRDLSSMMRPNL
eukprot:ANDGO_02254.mRNA.1 hypothetical protein AMSG_11699